MPGISWPAPLVRGVFVSRPNRFTVLVELAGRVQPAHLANSGRLAELLVPGHPIWCLPRRQPGRRTGWEAVLAAQGSTRVALPSYLANDVFAATLAGGCWPGLPATAGFQRERRWGDSRVDFRLAGEPPCLVEVKSVTLVKNGYALFPDAPTARGARHLENLAAAVRSGLEAAVVFVVLRSDARAFRPHRERDAAFAGALGRAAAAGVRVLAGSCRAGTRGVSWLRRLPVEV